MTTTNTNTKNKFAMGFFVLSAIALSGCSNNLLTKTLSAPKISSGSSTGSSTESGSTDNGSRIEAPPTVKTYSKEVAICNSTNMNYLKAQLMVYYENSVTVRKEFMRLWIPRIATDFDVSNSQVRFYKFKTNEKGEVWPDPDALKIKIEKKSGFTTATGYIEALNWGLIKKAMSANNLTTDTLTKFLENYSFVIDLKDLNGDYEGLKIAVYNAQGNKIEEKNMLLPPFYAHPASFENYNPYLKDLHPFIEMITSAWTVDFYKEQLNKNCFN